MSAKKMDRYDKMILEILQKDAHITNKELSEKIGLAPSSTLLRVKDLKDNKIIKEVVAVLDEARLGYPITVMARITLSPLNKATSQAFLEKVAQFPQITECFAITGNGSFLLKILTRDLHYYERFIISELLDCGSIHAIESSVVTSAPKLTTAIPLD